MPGIFYFMSILHSIHYLQYVIGFALFLCHFDIEYFPIYTIVFV